MEAVPPVVSAIVTSYDHERYLARALESALAQELDGLEVIAVDDASNDGSPAVLERYAGDPRLRIEVHGRNRGITATFNHGLELARGRYAAFLGSDDYWHPGHLAAAVAALDGSEAALCYARVRVVDEADRDVTGRGPAFGSAPDAEFFASLLVRSNFVPFVSAVFRRDVALEAGGFDPALAVLQDYDLWLRVAAGHPVCFSDHTAGAFRWDGANASGRSAENSVRLRRELARVLERWLRERPDDVRRAGAERSVRHRLAASYRRIAHRQSDPAERARYYGASLRHRPVQPGVVSRLLATRLRSWVGGGG